jgi:hypothetical protein
MCGYDLLHEIGLREFQFSNSHLFRSDFSEMADRLPRVLPIQRFFFRFGTLALSTRSTGPSAPFSINDRDLLRVSRLLRSQISELHFPFEVRSQIPLRVSLCFSRNGFTHSPRSDDMCPPADRRFSLLQVVQGFDDFKLFFFTFSQSASTRVHDLSPHALLAIDGHGLLQDFRHSGVSTFPHSPSPERLSPRVHDLSTCVSHESTATDHFGASRFRESQRAHQRKPPECNPPGVSDLQDTHPLLSTVRMNSDTSAFGSSRFTQSIFLRSTKPLKRRIWCHVSPGTNG